MTKIDDGIVALDRALELTRELSRDIDKIILRQRLTGIIIVIVLMGFVFWIATHIP